MGAGPMKSVFQLSKFVKSPSSAQVIYEEKNITTKDIFKAKGAHREEL